MGPTPNDNSHEKFPFCFCDHFTICSDLNAIQRRLCLPSAQTLFKPAALRQIMCNYSDITVETYIYQSNHPPSFQNKEKVPREKKINLRNVLWKVLPEMERFWEQYQLGIPWVEKWQRIIHNWWIINYDVQVSWERTRISSMWRWHATRTKCRLRIV